MTPPTSYALVLNNGVTHGGYASRAQAHKRAAELNRESAAARARGDLVSLRRIVGVITIKHKPLRQIEKPKPRRGRPRKVKP